ncbi:uncharacterized protein [Musca autumnalis]|uniref:uncharacterized protein n=1 Tax=Musca autumnalis TaxID=221902 RepID=UPI003CF003EC
MKILFLLVLIWAAANTAQSHLTVGNNDDPIPEHNNAGLWSVLYSKLNLLMNETAVLRENLVELRQRQDYQENRVTLVVQNLLEESTKFVEDSISKLKEKQKAEESRISSVIDNISSDAKVFLETGLGELKNRQDVLEENISNLIQTVTLSAKKSMEETVNALQKRLDDQEVGIANLVDSLANNSKKYTDAALEELKKRQEIGEDRILQLANSISSDAKVFLETGLVELQKRQDQQVEQIGNLIHTVSANAKQSVEESIEVLQKRLDNQEVRVTHLVDSLTNDSKKYMENGMEEIRKSLSDQEERVNLALQNISINVQKSMESNLEGFKQSFNNLEERHDTQQELSLRILENTAPKSYSFEETVDVVSLNRHREWTTISRRLDGSVAFDLGWEDYKKGFGNPNGEFFLGLEKLHALTTYGATQELLVVLKDHQNQTRYAKYDIFRVGSEAESYVIKDLGHYDGDAGDSLRVHVGAAFATKDNNRGNFPTERGGGWWRSVQTMCDLHSYYNPVDDVYGIFWGTWNGWKYTLKSAEMMIRSKP